MSAPDLELTGATEAAAEAMYDNYAARRLREGEAAVFLPPWADLQPRDQFYWRQLVLPAVTAALPHLARQAWELAAAEGDIEGFGIAAANPWVEPEDWDDAAKRL